MSDDGSLGVLIREHGVTHLQCTPSMAGMILMNDDDRAALGSLQALLIGGEALPAPLADELLSATGAVIVNMYGPTETTVWSSTQVVERGESITVGRPIANTRLYILDQRRRPVPIGVAGELYIGGEGVVRGYLGRPELTAERFIPDPFSREPGARLYRTGDLARYLPDGRVELLGRSDQQVKIRGHRIELGEIEAELARCSGVREAVVVARGDSPGDRRLVAYLVAHAGEEIAVGELRRALRAALPEFMVPSRFLVLAAMPLLPNRKIDRKALPAAETVEAPGSAAVAAAAPATRTEQTIAAIWQDVLGIRHAGVDDNFFDLGGHSLLAVKAHARLKATFASDLAITDLFRFPTVRSLARFLGDSSGGRDGALEASEERGAARRELMAQRRRRTQRQR
jgi:acyl-coenzyme A synthetase/AMP-(fatty) acid ligase